MSDDFWAKAVTFFMDHFVEIYIISCIIDIFLDAYIIKKVYSFVSKKISQMRQKKFRNGEAQPMCGEDEPTEEDFDQKSHKNSKFSFEMGTRTGRECFCEKNARRSWRRCPPLDADLRGDSTRW